MSSIRKKYLYKDLEGSFPLPFNLDKDTSFIRYAQLKFLLPYFLFFSNGLQWKGNIDSSILAFPTDSNTSCVLREIAHMSKLVLSILPGALSQIERYAIASNSFILSQRICRDYQLSLRTRTQRLKEAFDLSVGIACINAQVRGMHI